jgi:hypothetical protein
LTYEYARESHNIRLATRIAIAVFSTPAKGCGIRDPVREPNFVLKNRVARNSAMFQNSMPCPGTTCVTNGEFDPGQKSLCLQPVPLAPRLCPVKELWEASPTPISPRNTTRCGVVTDIGVRDPSYNEFLGKALAPPVFCKRDWNTFENARACTSLHKIIGALFEM